MIDNGNSASPSALGPLDDPFENWPNSDLLINDEDRAFFRRRYPAIAPVFDWPELRELFAQYDKAATRAREHSSRFGVLSVVSGFLSLCVAAAVPLAVELSNSGVVAQLRIQAVLGGLAAVLAIVSIVIGYTQVLRGKEKARWLLNRFWTERIRQFHFQLILNHLPAIIAAIKHRNGLQQWLAFRAGELDQFEHHYLRGVADKIHHLREDDAEDHPWLSEDWDHSCSVPEACPEFDELLKLLDQQRFGIQQRYTERKLMRGWHSPNTRAQVILHLSDTLTAVLLVATSVVGIGSITAFELGSKPHYLSIVGLVGAISGAGVVAMRALKEGLLFSADAERYKWYLAAVQSLSRRFENADRERKIHLLRELEHVAYQEMRRFIVSVSGARFVL